MKRILALALVSVLAAAGAAAQSTPVEPGLGIRRGDTNRSAPPVTNPEPVTLAALAGGAAIAGGALLRRRGKAKA